MSAVLAPRRTVAVLITALIVDMLAFTCILPLFPSILNFYSKDGHRDGLYDLVVKSLQWFQELIGAPLNTRYNNVFFGGLLGSMFSALQFISSPTLGALSDVYGRRQMLMLGCLGTLISYLIWFRAETFTLFVISRIVGGLSKSNINVATAIVADVFPPEDHPKGMALIGIAYSVGFLVGPMIGAYFSTFAAQEALFTTPAKFAIILTGIQFIIITFFLPETLDFEKRKSLDQVKTKASKLTSLASLFQFEAVDAPITKKLQMMSFGLVYFLYLFLYAGLEFTLPFLTHTRFDFGSMEQGKIYLFTGLVMLPIQGRIVRKTPLHKQKRMAELGVTCIVPAFLVIAGANSVFMLYIGLFLYAIASAIVVTCLTSCVSSLHTASDKGAITGVFRSLGSLARAVGPICASTLFWHLGPSTCYTIGAILLIVPLVMLRKMANPVDIPEEKEKTN